MMAEKCGFISCLNPSDGESNFCSSDRCPGLTTKGTRCKSSTNCKVSHKSYVGQQQFNNQEEAVKAETVTFKQVRLFHIVGVHTYDAVKFFFFAKKEMIRVTSFADARSQARELVTDALVDHVKCWLFQFDGKTYAMKLDGTWKQLEGDFTIKADKFRK